MVPWRYDMGMTLKSLKKKFPTAYKAWRALDHGGVYERTREELDRITFRAYLVNGHLYAVWNNGCYYAAYRYRDGEWGEVYFKGRRKDYIPAYYRQGCKTLGDLDRTRLYVPVGV